MAKKRRSLVVEGAGAAVPVVAGLAGVPAAGGLVKFVTLLRDLVDEQRNRRREKFVQDFLESGTPNEAAVAELEAALRDPEQNAREVVLDAVRALDDLVCDEVVPALALLAREYVRADRAKDRFCASLLRFLRDLEAGEFLPLRELVGVVVTKYEGAQETFCVISRIEMEEEAWVSVALGSEYPWGPQLGPLLRSLVAHGLATLLPGNATQKNASESWRVELSVWRRLWDIFEHCKLR